MTKREQPEVTKIAVIDIETLAKSEKSKIASIGCVILDIKTLEILPDVFYVPIDITDQKGRVSDESTMFWWLKQMQENKRAAEAAFGEPKVWNLTAALKRLSHFLARNFGDEPVNMFGNGPEFDNVILADAFDQYGIKLPWDYWNNQSVRTMLLTYRMISGNQQPDIEFEGIKHHALYDAIHEAKIIAESLRFIRDGVNSVKPLDEYEGLRQRSNAWLEIYKLLSDIDGKSMELSDSGIDSAIKTIRKLEQQSKEGALKVVAFDKAIQQIAEHVGACCGGVDVFDNEMPGYSHTAAEIIRKIDEKSKPSEQVNSPVGAFSEHPIVSMARAKLLIANANLKNAQADEIRKRLNDDSNKDSSETVK